MRNVRILAFAGVSLLTMAAPAYAQNAPADYAKIDLDIEIVGSGRLIRGIAPGG